MLGCVLGAAIGDALGHPTEFLDPAAIRARWGERGLTGFELWWDGPDGRFAPYTDDTQMAECVLRSLIEQRVGGWDLDRTMGDLAERFVAWMKHPQGGHRAPGNACLAGCQALAAGTPWREAGGPDAGGCGSVMRAWPFGLAWIDDPGRAERDAVAHSALTHRAPIALAACAGLAQGVAAAVRGEDPAEVCRLMTQAAFRYDERTGGMIGWAVSEAREGVEPDVVFDRLRAWAAHEAIAAAAYLFARHPDDPRAAMLEGANTPGDSDSIASIAGALIGARVGLSRLPPEWVEGVERSAELLELGRALA